MYSIVSDPQPPSTAGPSGVVPSPPAFTPLPSITPEPASGVTVTDKFGFFTTIRPPLTFPPYKITSEATTTDKYGFFTTTRPPLTFPPDKKTTKVTTIDKYGFFTTTRPPLTFPPDKMINKATPTDSYDFESTTRPPIIFITVYDTEVPTITTEMTTLPSSGPSTGNEPGSGALATVDASDNDESTPIIDSQITSELPSQTFETQTTRIPSFASVDETTTHQFANQSSTTLDPLGFKTTTRPPLIKPMFSTKSPSSMYTFYPETINPFFFVTTPRPIFIKPTNLPYSKSPQTTLNPFLSYTNTENTNVDEDEEETNNALSIFTTKRPTFSSTDKNKLPFTQVLDLLAFFTTPRPKITKPILSSSNQFTKLPTISNAALPIHPIYTKLTTTRSPTNINGDLVQSIVTENSSFLTIQNNSTESSISDITQQIFNNLTSLISQV